jgi:hypothetical protein
MTNGHPPAPPPPADAPPLAGRKRPRAAWERDTPGNAQDTRADNSPPSAGGAEAATPLNLLPPAMQGGSCAAAAWDLLLAAAQQEEAGGAAAPPLPQQAAPSSPPAPQPPPSPPAAPQARVGGAEGSPSSGPFRACTGLRGVGRQGPSYRARLPHNRGHVCIGSFSTPEEAAVAYDCAKLAVRGPTAAIALNYSSQRYSLLQLRVRRAGGPRGSQRGGARGDGVWGLWGVGEGGCQGPGVMLAASGPGHKAVGPR